MKKAVYDQTGKEVDKIDLNKTVFGQESVNDELLNQVYKAILANKRLASASTKSRGMVVGSTRKLFRQKGTGSARAGSANSPIRRGGGVIFGPTGQENYKQKINKKSKKAALRQALSVQGDLIKVINQLKSDGKTKSMNKALAKNLKLTKKTLVVVRQVDQLVKRSVNNLANVVLKPVDYLSVVDVLDADSILIDKESIQYLTNNLTNK